MAELEMEDKNCSGNMVEAKMAEVKEAGVKVVEVKWER